MAIWVFTQSRGITIEVFTKATNADAGTSNFTGIFSVSGIFFAFLICFFTNRSVYKKADQLISYLVNSGPNPLKRSLTKDFYFEMCSKKPGLPSVFVIRYTLVLSIGQVMVASTAATLNPVISLNRTSLVPSGVLLL